MLPSAQRNKWFPAVATSDIKPKTQKNNNTVLRPKIHQLNLVPTPPHPQSTFVRPIIRLQKINAEQRLKIRNAKKRLSPTEKRISNTESVKNKKKINATRLNCIFMEVFFFLNVKSLLYIYMDSVSRFSLTIIGSTIIVFFVLFFEIQYKFQVWLLCTLPVCNQEEKKQRNSLCYILRIKKVIRRV